MGGGGESGSERRRGQGRRCWVKPSTMASTSRINVWPPARRRGGRAVVLRSVGPTSLSPSLGGRRPPPKGCSVAWVWCCDARPFLWRPNLNPPPPRCVVGVVSASQTNHSTWSTIAPLLCVAILQTVTPPADSWLSKRHTFESRPPPGRGPPGRPGWTLLSPPLAGIDATL